MPKTDAERISELLTGTQPVTNNSVNVVIETMEKEGTMTVEQLAKLNAKYPSDPVFFAKQELRKRFALPDSFSPYLTVKQGRKAVAYKRLRTLAEMQELGQLLAKQREAAQAKAKKQ